MVDMMFSFKKYNVRNKIFLFLFSFFVCSTLNYVLADSTKEFVDIVSPSAVVMDSDSGRVLYEKNADDKRKIASLTKVMTSILLVENCKMDEMIEIPAAATWIGGSEVGLKKGDKVSARSLLYGMLLPSGNDCAYTTGLHIGGTIENFAKMMNEKAKEIGATNTNFTNPHGLDDDENYSTAKDMALITRYAFKNKYIDEAVGTKSITINFGSFSKLLTNTNALLRTYPQADGGKTGFTNGANRCLIASATSGDSRYISVLLGADTTQKRFGESKEILEESFKRYTNMDVSKYLNFYIKIPVVKGNIEYYEKQISDNLLLPLTQEEFDGIYVKQELIQNIEAPLDVGTKLGVIRVYLPSGEIIYENEVFLDEGINKKSILDYMKDGFENMFKERSRL